MIGWEQTCWETARGEPQVRRGRRPPRPRLTARVNPTIHVAMLRIVRADDGWSDDGWSDIAITSPIPPPRPRLTARVNPTRPNPYIGDAAVKIALLLTSDSD